MLTRRRDPPATAGRLDADRVMEAIAARQHGVVARAQLLRAGLSADVVDRRIAAGRLRPLHRGVYQVGPLVAPRAVQMAALLACGHGAVVSHWSAAVLWQIRRARNGDAAVDVIVTRRNPGVRRGVRLHRVVMLRSEDVTVLEQLTITTPARTLYDLAGSVPRRELERALAQALALEVVTRQQLRRMIDRHPGRPGTRRLRRLLEDTMRPAMTRSEAEERFLGLIRDFELPAPEVNVALEAFEVDFFWRTERLAVEIDGFAFHSSHSSFESDRRRDAVLAAAGIRVMRVTWAQLVNETGPVMVRIAQALVRAL